MNNEKNYTDEEFNKALATSIEGIYEASVK